MKQCPICTTDYPDERKTCPTDGAMLRVNSDWSPGTLIKGKYRIIARLGRGGMGTVYKAEHIPLEEVRALKVMAPTGDAEFVRRFRQEAQAARRLRHPNVVHVDDLDQADDGSFFIAMDYVDGVSLRQLLQVTKGPLPLMRTLGIVRSVGEALAAAHALGMVHRDIKPENILFVRDPHGRDIPKILDFGIVAMKENSSTQSTRYLLTPAQGSPEQWKGLKSSELDGRADLYALGVVWYEMLTGRLPLYAHTNEGWMRAHLDEIPQPPSRLNPELAQHPNLDALVLKLLAKDREQRPQDAQSFLGELNLIEAKLSWNDTAVATPRIQGDATAMFRSPAREAAFQTPSPPQQEPTPQPSFEAASIARTAIYNERSRVILPRPVRSPEPQPHRSKLPRLVYKAALILIASAVVAEIVVLGVIHRSRSKVADSAALARQAQPLQSSIPTPAPSNPPEGVSRNRLPGNQAAAQPQSNMVQRTPQTLSSLQEAKSIGLSATSTKKGAQGGQTSQKAPLVVPSPLLNPPAKPAGELNKQGALLEANGMLSEAVNSNQAPCDGGEVADCSRLGDMYLSGRGVATDNNRAVQLLQKSCDGGDAPGCTNLGLMYENGQEVPKDNNRAVQLLQKGCDGGNAHGCSNLGAMHENGQGVPNDDNRAVQLFQKGCNGGDAFGCSGLGAIYANGRGGIPKDDNRAVQLLQKGCDGGNAFGCSGLGTMYANGRGVPKDDKRGVQFYQEGCEGGNAEGCTHLGFMYAKGRGVKKDKNRAAQLLQLGCDLGDALACATVKK
jgi:TPR repeat protein/serine/threonine protein kinase